MAREVAVFSLLTTLSPLVSVTSFLGWLTVSCSVWIILSSSDFTVPEGHWYQRLASFLAFWEKKNQRISKVIYKTLFTIFGKGKIYWSVRIFRSNKNIFKWFKFNHDKASVWSLWERISEWCPFSAGGRVSERIHHMAGREETAWKPRFFWISERQFCKTLD